MKLNRVLLCLGLALSGFSMWDTLGHSWDPAFQAPALSLGPTHTQYHAFREFTLSVGAAAVLLYVMFLPSAQRMRSLWTVMCVTAVCYTGDGGYLGPCLGYTGRPSGNLRASGRNDSQLNERSSGVAVLFPIANRPTWK